MADPVARNQLLHKLHAAATKYDDARAALKIQWQSIPELEHVIADAEKRNVPLEEIVKTKTTLSQKKAFQEKAHAGLRAAVLGFNIDTLERAIQAAENHAAPYDEIAQAKTVLANMKAHTALNA